MRYLLVFLPKIELPTAKNLYLAYKLPLIINYI